jgi:hypothetical protein
MANLKKKQYLCYNNNLTNAPVYAVYNCEDIDDKHFEKVQIKASTHQSGNETEINKELKEKMDKWE